RFKLAVGEAQQRPPAIEMGDFHVKVATEAPMRGVEKLRDALRAQQRLGETGDEASAIAYQRGFFGQQGADGPQVAAGKRLHEFVQQAVVGFRVYREAWLFFAQLRSG